MYSGFNIPRGAVTIIITIFFFFSFSLPFYLLLLHLHTSLISATIIPYGSFFSLFSAYHYLHPSMALDSLFSKLKSAISHTFDSPKPTLLHHPDKPHSYNKRSNVGVLAFEISGLMSKLLHLWQSLSDKNMARLRNESILLEGVRKIVSNDDVFLLGLACAELTENLKLIVTSISRLSRRCEDSNLRSFDRLIYEFADTGRDLHNWVLSWKEMESRNKKMESRNKKMDRFVTLTATLHKEMDELVALETSLRKYKKSCNSNNNDHDKLIDIQQKISWKKQEVKCLKERSLWNRSFDTVTSILAKSVFTVLARIKLVFGIGHGHPSSLPRCLSASAAVYPSENPPPASCNLRISNASFHDMVHNLPSSFAGTATKEEVQVKDWKMSCEFFELNSKLLSPPASTLGASALSLHYANVIIVMEKMIRSPHLVGVDARDDLYAMLPNSIRLCLRCRLRGVGFAASDPMLAAEWKDALGRILGWLSPLAHNMIKWQSERSFEHQNLVPKTNVLLLQTLYFANKEKAEAAITELLVGLNYIWRYEREMNAKALFECFNIK